MTSICGMQSLKFENAPYLKGWASVAGKKEGEGPLGNLIDQIIEDPYFGQESWELAEGRFMKQAAMLAISKADLHKKDIRYAFAGDLLEQNTATFSGMKELGIPLFGLFGACSTVGEAMSLAAMSVAGGFAKHSLAIASSHIGSAEKQFRFPLEYGNQRPLSATWTVTGSGGFIVSKEIGPVKIQGITTGKIVDYGMEDPMNMGACHGASSGRSNLQHFVDFGSKPEDYDAVYTGDLGEVGKKILLHLLRENGYDLSKVHGDCGIEIYENETQDTHSGGSGCACSAVVLASMIIPKLIDGTWKKVLFVPTGALMSKTSFNEGENGCRDRTCDLSGRSKIIMEYIRAFLVGGIICILVQILMDHTTLQPGRIMVLLVIAGVILGALGIYKRIEEFGGCGATVPLSGFGFSLWKGMKEAVDNHGFLGLFEGGFTAAAVGTSAALIFSYLASLIFQPKIKK